MNVVKRLSTPRRDDSRASFALVLASKNNGEINIMDRKRFLKEVEQTLEGDRQVDYGDASKNFARIARMWEVIFGHQVTLEQVHLAMIAVKMSRLVNSPGHQDSWIDIAGYAALAAELKELPQTIQIFGDRNEPQQID
jgi:hypothetical protein